MLERDRGFAERFGYDGVPLHLISDDPGFRRPTLLLRTGTQASLEICSRGAVFDHPAWLSNSFEVPDADASSDLRRRYDVVLHAHFSETRFPAGALSMLASLLRPGGQVLLRVEVF